MSTLFPFLKEEKIGLRTQETFVGKKLEIYLPSYYIDKNDNRAIALDLGDKIESIGLFWFKVNDTDWYELQLPLKFQFQFSSFRKERVKIQPNMPEAEYIVYELKNGDAFIYNVLHKQNVDDMAKDFFGKLIQGAKIPPTVAYEDVADIFFKAMSSSKYTSLGVSALSIELLLSEIYRVRKNLHDPFRLAYNGNNKYDYQMVRITKVPELNSTFTGLIGEDVTSQIVSAVVKNRSGVEEKESPIEKSIKY